MEKLYQVAFWVFVALFAIDIIAPTYTNAENFALMAILMKIASLTPGREPEQEQPRQPQ